MTDAYLDGLLDELVDAEPSGTWNDVVSRARRSRRRYTVVASAIAALVLAPTAWAIAHAFEGKPAPPAIKSLFQEHNTFARRFAKALGRREPKAIVSRAHGVIQVRTTKGFLDLWAAPASDGGTCYLVGWQSTGDGVTGTCVPASAKDSRSATQSLNVSWGGDYLHRDYEVVEGYAYRGAKTVSLALEDGRFQTLPVVEGLFLGAIHRRSRSLRLHRGIKIVSATARDAHGRVVGTWALPAR